MTENPILAADPAAADTDVVRLIVRGDHAALERLMRSNNRKLFRVARAILGDDSEAEDALQDAYVSAYLEMSTFRGTSKLSTWLTRIVINQALGRLRKQKRQAAVFAFSEDSRERPEQESEAMA